jgi:hypothetical protein
MGRGAFPSQKICRALKDRDPQNRPLEGAPSLSASFADRVGIFSTYRGCPVFVRVLCGQGRNLLEVSRVPHPCPRPLRTGWEFSRGFEGPILVRVLCGQGGNFLDGSRVPHPCPRPLRTGWDFSTFSRSQPLLLTSRVLFLLDCFPLITWRIIKPASATATPMRGRP